jgi:type VI secretion system protein ImpJ
LRNGTVALLSAKGVMPDGLGFHIPESDPKPAVRAIDEIFSPTRDFHLILLALPERQDRGINFSGNGATGEYRYQAQAELLTDETTGLGEKAGLARTPQFSSPARYGAGRRNGVAPGGARASATDRAGTPTTPITFRRASTSPPATGLITMLRELTGMLEERSRLMGSQQRSSGQAPADYWRRDLASFWFLHTIHGSLGVLRHLLLAKHGHPEELWQELGRLGGALCSFSLDSHPRDLPLYDHERLTEGFEAVEAHIRRHLDLIVPVNVVTVPLQPTDNYFWTAKINDPRLLDRSRWLLEIQSKIGEASLIQRTPQLVKFCSEKYIRELVRRAMPGLALTHLSVPPPQVAARVEAQYFGISKAGPCWESIMKDKRVGMYVPGDLPSPELSLIILLDN